jgi:hypothetical protein
MMLRLALVVALATIVGPAHAQSASGIKLPSCRTR